MHTALRRRRGALGNSLGQGGWESRFQRNILAEPPGSKLQESLEVDRRISRLQVYERVIILSLTLPNHGLEPTPSSVRCAPASRRG
jgi:hypothetical protein